MIAHVLQKVEAKILQKFRFLEYFLKAKREECDQKNWTVCNKFGIIIPCEATYSLEVGPGVSLKVATKVFLEVKKTIKIKIFRQLF